MDAPRNLENGLSFGMTPAKVDSMLPELSHEAKLRRTLWIIILFWVGGCQAIQGVDTQATLRADIDAYATEAAALDSSMRAQETRIHATAAAAGTEVSQISSANEQLAGTARVFVPATAAVVAGIAPASTAGMLDDAASNQQQFVQTATAANVRASDGCPVAIQSNFTPDTPRIYVTASLSNRTEAMQMSVEWSYQGTVVFSDSWTVNPSGGTFCAWYYITPDDVPFTPGDWSVRLLANGLLLGSPAPFVIDAA